MLYKRNLAYLAEDYDLDYDDFVNYCFANYPQSVWQVYDGIKYCHDGCAEYLVKEYKEFKRLVYQYNIPLETA